VRLGAGHLVAGG